MVHIETLIPPLDFEYLKLPGIFSAIIPECYCSISHFGPGVLPKAAEGAPGERSGPLLRSTKSTPSGRSVWPSSQRAASQSPFPWPRDPPPHIQGLAPTLAHWVFSQAAGPPPHIHAPRPTATRYGWLPTTHDESDPWPPKPPPPVRGSSGKVRGAVKPPNSPSNSCEVRVPVRPRD